VADFGAIVHRREPDNPVKDGALSEPFLLLPRALVAKSVERFAEQNVRAKSSALCTSRKIKTQNGLWKGSNSGSNPDGSAILFHIF